MPSLSGKSVIAFDLDGTLIDSMTFFGEIAASVMARTHGAEYGWALGEYRRTCGIPFDHQVEEIFPGDARNALALADFDRQKAENYARCPFFADVDDAFDAFRARGLKLVVSSNNEQSIVSSRFPKNDLDLILGFRKPDFLKGAPHFDAIQKAFGVSSEQILFVGDSLHDAVAAQKSHIDFVARTGTFTADEFKSQQIATRIIAHLGELTD